MQQKCTCQITEVVGLWSDSLYTFNMVTVPHKMVRLENVRFRECRIIEVPLCMYMYSRTCLVSTWFSTYSWIVSTPHSVHVYTSCT